MKKLLVALLVVATLAMACFAQDITVTLNGQAIDFADQAPEIVEGRTLVPLRAIFEALGASVEWDQATKTVTSSMDDVTIKLTIGDNTLYRNDEGVTLDVAAQILNGRTMVPARAIAEAYGVGVQWDAATRTVVLTKETKSDNVLPADSFVKYSEAHTGGAEALHTTADPVNADNTVLELRSISGEATNWTYLWVPATFKPGERYLVNYDVYLDTDALGNEITDGNASVGVCFAYEEIGGNFSHHGGTIDGKQSLVILAPKTWTSVSYVYEMPETLNEDGEMLFGIYSNPITVEGYYDQLSTSYYLDNISVEVYDGEAATGPYVGGLSDDESSTPVDLNIETAVGFVYDFDDDIGEISPNSPTDVKDGYLYFDATGNNDPILLDTSVRFAAEDYCGVMVKMKYEDYVLVDERYPETFGVYFGTTADSELSQSKYADTMFKFYEPDADGWYTLYVDMTKNPYWTGDVIIMRFDPLNGEAKMVIDKIVIVAK